MSIILKASDESLKKEKEPTVHRQFRVTVTGLETNEAISILTPTMHVH